MQAGRREIPSLSEDTDKLCALIWSIEIQERPALNKFPLVKNCFLYISQFEEACCLKKFTKE